MIFSTQNTSPLEMGWTLCRGARCEVGLGFVVRSSLYHHATIGYQTNLMVFGRSRSSKPSLCRRWCCGWGNFHVESNGFV